MSISREVEQERLKAALSELTPSQRKIYAQVMAKDGPGSERFALMCATQSPPGSRNTDRAFCEGARRQMESMGERNRKAILAKAKAAGIPTDGKFYKGVLGGYTDPAAWVSNADDVLAVCKAKNLNCEGVINHKATNIEGPPPAPKPLADDIVSELCQREAMQNPDLLAKCKRDPKAKQELVEQIREKHSRRPAQSSGRQGRAKRRAG